MERNVDRGWFSLRKRPTWDCRSSYFNRLQGNKVAIWEYRTAVSICTLAPVLRDLRARSTRKARVPTMDAATAMAMMAATPACRWRLLARGGFGAHSNVVFIDRKSIPARDAGCKHLRHTTQVKKAINRYTILTFIGFLCSIVQFCLIFFKESVAFVEPGEDLNRRGSPVSLFGALHTTAVVLQKALKRKVEEAPERRVINRASVFSESSCPVR